MQTILSHILKELFEIRRVMATKDDIAQIRIEMATKDELNELREQMATKEDLKRFATKEDIADMATKKDIANMATKTDIQHLTKHMIEYTDIVTNDLYSRIKTNTNEIDQLKQHLNQ